MAWEFQNQLSGLKIGYLVFMVFMIFFLNWASINSAVQYQVRATGFMIIGIIGLIVWLFDKITEKEGEESEALIETCIWEKESLFGKLEGIKFFVYIMFCIGFAIFIFFNTFITGYSVIGAPAQLFQAIDIGVGGDIAISIAGAMIENLLFFYIIMPTIFGILWFVTKNKYFAFMASVFILTPLIFMGWHFGVYGIENVSAMISVYLFGSICSFFTFIFRTPIFADLFHISNNLGVLFAKTTRVAFVILGGGG